MNSTTDTFQTLTIVVQTSRFHRGEQAEAKYLVRQELARRGLAPASSPQHGHVFASDGFRSLRQEGRTWTATVRVR